MKTHLEKIKVCTSCLSDEVTDIDCVCTYQDNYDTVEIEKEVCDCCGRSRPGVPDTEFNTTQLTN